MGFVLLLALSIASLARVQGDLNAALVDRLEARQNGVLGLRVAVGALQSEAGGDRVATGAAALLDGVAHPHWTGVWNTEAGVWEDPLSGPPPAYATEAKRGFRRWLVSGDPGVLGDLERARTDSGSADDRVRLVGRGTAGDEAAAHVSVPRAAVGDSGAYAFWIGDEGSKAKVNVDAALDDSGDAGRRNFMSAPRFAAEHLPGASLSDSSQARLERLSSVTEEGQLRFGEALGLSAAEAETLFHDLTAHSRGLLTDARNGGLRRDLTRVLAGPELADNEAPTPSTAAELDDYYGDDPGRIVHFRSGNPEGRAGFFTLREPSWKRLQSYYQLGERFREEGALEARIGGFEEETVTPVVTQAGYSMLPAVDLNLASDTRREDADGDGLPDEPMAFVSYMEFQAVLWNPYNVPLRIPEEGMILDFLHWERFDSATYRVRPGFKVPGFDPKDEEGAVAFLDPVYQGDFEGGEPTEGIVDVHDEAWRDNSADATGLAFKIEGGAELAPGEVAMFTPREEVDYEEASDGGGPVLVQGNTGNAVRFRQTFDITLRNDAGEKVPHPYSVDTVLDPIKTPDGQELIDTPDGKELSLEHLLDKGVAFFGEQKADENQVALSRGGLNRVGLRRVVDASDNTEGADDLDNLYLYREGHGHPAGENLQKPPTPFTLRDYIKAPGIAMDGEAPLDPNRLNYFFRSVVGDTERGDPYYVSDVFNPLSWTEQFNPRARASVKTSIDERGDAPWLINPVSLVGWNYNPWVTATDGSGHAFFGPSQESGIGRTRVIATEVPRASTPPGSIASLRHANLFNVNRTLAYPIGQSSPHVHLGALDSVRRTTGNRGHLYPATVFAVDTAFFLNRALWDAWFLSSFEGDTLTPDDVANGGVEQTNARYVIDRGERSADAVAEALRDPDTAAAHLRVDGMFNVNSTSVAAWKAFLGGGNRLAFDPESGNAGDPLENPVSRFAYPEGGSGDAWLGFRELSDADLTALAEEIVEHVKERGPFLSLAGFVNRRIVDGPQGHGGPLARAIEEAGINGEFENRSQKLERASLNPFHGDWLEAAYDGFSNEDAPGWINQADLLRAVGPYIAVRSDTFRVRFYGASSNVGGEAPEAEAWGEAIVQRVAEPVDPAGADGRARWTADGPFGRKFEIVGFRWLAKDEI